MLSVKLKKAKTSYQNPLCKCCVLKWQFPTLQKGAVFCFMKKMLKKVWIVFHCLEKMWLFWWEFLVMKIFLLSYRNFTILSVTHLYKIKNITIDTETKGILFEANNQKHTRVHFHLNTCLTPINATWIPVQLGKNKHINFTWSHARNQKPCLQWGYYSLSTTQFCKKAVPDSWNCREDSPTSSIQTVKENRVLDE